MINIVDLVKEDKTYKLWNFSEFSDLIKEKVKSLYQPDQNAATDKWIVESKHHSRAGQYIKNKPVKFQLKLWVLPVTRGTHTLFMQEKIVVKPSVKMV